MKTLLRKMPLTTIVTVLTVMTTTMSLTVFSTTTAPVAFGERIMLDSEQSVTVTTKGLDQDNATDRHINSLRITQNPESGLDVECGGDLRCEILDNNTVVATTGENTTTMITSALNPLNQSLVQSLNQSSILVPFSNSDSDMLNNDFDIFNGQDLDSEIDEWIDRMLNETLGNMRAPVQTLPDLPSVSV
jgi:hypothetical protein